MTSMRFRNGLRIKDLAAELSTRFTEIISLFHPVPIGAFVELETCGTLQQAARRMSASLRKRPKWRVVAKRRDGPGADITHVHV
jgi:hypothetical protein